MGLPILRLYNSRLFFIGVIVSHIQPISPFAIVSERLVQLEQMLRQAEKKGTEAINIVSDLRRRFDHIGFLYDTSRRLIQHLPLGEVLDLIVDILWRQQYSFVVILLGETESGRTSTRRCAA